MNGISFWPYFFLPNFLYSKFLESVGGIKKEFWGSFRDILEDPLGKIEKNVKFGKLPEIPQNSPKFPEENLHFFFTLIF
jgi:hypothetical protein